jgi:hypothetical protein
MTQCRINRPSLQCACDSLCWFGRSVLQYPEEKEITFPPFTCLEADGDPRVEWTKEGGEIVVFPLKVAPPSPPFYFTQNAQKHVVPVSGLCKRRVLCPEASCH